MKNALLSKLLGIAIKSTDLMVALLGRMYTPVFSFQSVC